MRAKKSQFYLTNGKQDLCWECKSHLEIRNKTFDIKKSNSEDKMEVTEQVLYCSHCHVYYLSQALCKLLTQKYPGYYADVSFYSIKQKKHPRFTTKDANRDIRTDKQLAMQTEKNVGVVDRFTTNIAMRNKQISLILSDTYNALHNICPKCSSAMTSTQVNVPVVFENGDFYRYYTETISYCYKCREGYMGSKKVCALLDRVLATTNENVKIKLLEGFVEKKSNQYLYAPIANTAVSVRQLDPEYVGNEYFEINDSEIEFRPVSFLGQMGYSTDRNTTMRHRVLEKAIATYGKRKVADHIAFLIENRKRQKGGSEKYANAIRIWQSDLNFVYRLSDK